MHWLYSVWPWLNPGAFVPDANLWHSALGLQPFHMYEEENNMSRHAKPILLARGFVHGLGIDVAHWGGQSVPLCLHHEAAALAAVGSRCSVLSGKGLQGPQHSALQGLHITESAKKSFAKL